MRTRFGKYELIDRVASGDTSEVFTARYAGTQGFVKLLAVKRILSSLDGEAEFISALAADAKRLANLNQENVVQVYEFDRADDHYFVAMELVRGADLRRLLDRLEDATDGGPSRLRLPMAVYIASACLSGLMAAHERLDSRGRPRPVIHGNLCLRSVLVSHAGEIKLAAFGSARRQLRDPQISAAVEQRMAHFRPPETTAADLAGDLYAVGVILWELSTGQRLGDDRAPVPDPATLNAGISPGLRGVILTLLHPDPAERYPTARDALSALRKRADARDQSLELGELMEWCYPKESAASRRSSLSAPPPKSKTRTSSARSSRRSDEATRDPDTSGSTAPTHDLRKASDVAPPPGQAPLWTPQLVALLVAVIAAAVLFGYLLWERLAG